MKTLQHKNRSSYLILDEQTNNPKLLIEVHRDGCQVSQFINIDLNDYYECDSKFVLTQLNVALSDFLAISTKIK